MYKINEENMFIKLCKNTTFPNVYLHKRFERVVEVRWVDVSTGRFHFLFGNRTLRPVRLTKSYFNCLPAFWIPAFTISLNIHIFLIIDGTSLLSGVKFFLLDPFFNYRFYHGFFFSGMYVRGPHRSPNFL